MYIEVLKLPYSVSDDDWTDESAEAIWDMTHYLNGEKKFMLAKVCD